MAWRTLVWGVALAATFGVSGCTSILGDFGSASSNPDGGGGAPDGGSPRMDGGGGSHHESGSGGDHESVPMDAKSEMVVASESGPDATCSSGVVCSGVCKSDTDANNCGSCGHMCQGGTCSAGLCQPVTLYDIGAGELIADLATNGTAVAWAQKNDTINYVSGLGGSLVVLASSTQGVAGPVAITFASGLVDWLQYDGSNTSLGFATAGSAGSGMFGSYDYYEAAVGLVADGAGEYVYSVGSGINLFRLPSDDSNEAFSIYSETSTMSGDNLAIDPSSSYVVFGDVANSLIVDYQVSSMTATMITGHEGVNWVAADSSNAYWGETVGTTHPIEAAPLTALGTVSTVLADTGAAIDGIATDGKNVFFLANHVISYVSVAGGKSATVLASVANAEHLKAAGKGVFFDDEEKIYEVAAP